MAKRWTLRPVTVREYKLIQAGLARVIQNAERGMEECKGVCPSQYKLWKMDRNKARKLKDDLLEGMVVHDE